MTPVTIVRDSYEEDQEFSWLGYCEPHVRSCNIEWNTRNSSRRVKFVFFCEALDQLLSKRMHPAQCPFVHSPISHQQKRKEEFYTFVRHIEMSRLGLMPGVPAKVVLTLRQPSRRTPENAPRLHLTYRNAIPRSNRFLHAIHLLEIEVTVDSENGHIPARVSSARSRSRARERAQGSENRSEGFTEVLGPSHRLQRLVTPEPVIELDEETDIRPRTPGPPATTPRRRAATPARPAMTPARPATTPGRRAGTSGRFTVNARSAGRQAPPRRQPVDLGPRYPAFSSSWKVPSLPLSDITVQEGSVGTVKAVQIRNNAAVFAFKEVFRPHRQARDGEVFMRELHNLRRVRDSDYIANIRFVVTSNDPLTDGETPGAVVRGFLLEQYSTVTLAKAIEHGPPPFSMWWLWPLQILFGLTELHKQEIAQICLHPSNVVITPDLKAIVVDISGLEQPEHGWVPPALRDQERDDEPLSFRKKKGCDVWSWGKTMQYWIDTWYEQNWVENDENTRFMVQPAKAALEQTITNRKKLQKLLAQEMFKEPAIERQLRDDPKVKKILAQNDDD